MNTFKRGFSASALREIDQTTQPLTLSAVRPPERGPPTFRSASRMSCGSKTNLLPSNRPLLRKMLLVWFLVQRTQSVMFGLLLAVTLSTIARQ